MKKYLILLSILLALSINAQVHVRGYTRSNGTYVAPHMRSSPNSTPTDNYSYPGNTNPYTGKTATGNPDTYLKNYNNSSNTNTSDVWVSGYTRSEGTYVEGHWRSAPNSNPADNYSYPGNTNPYTGKTATGNSNIYLNNYYVKSNTLNVRSGPSKKYSVITSLNYGESIEIIGSSNANWTKVRINNFDLNNNSTKTRIGYVKSTYISSIFTEFSSVNDLSTDKYNNTYNLNNISFSNHPFGLNNGKIYFWTNCPDDGAISIFIDGVYKGQITLYFINSKTPSIGNDGTLGIVLPVGTYKVAANGTNNKWESYIVIRDDESELQLLSK